MMATGNQESELRFVVLMHRPGSKSGRTSLPHFDWMFEWEGRLRTWASTPIELTACDGEVETKEVEVDCQSLPEHRLAYLDYEGDIGRDRGVVTRRLAGTYRVIEAGADCFRVSLACPDGGRSQSAEVTIYRSGFSVEAGRFEESRASWRLRFSPGR